MAKKKKKDKTEEFGINYSFSQALKASKKTESTLQNMLIGFSEDSGLLKKKEEIIESNEIVTEEAKKKIAKDYIMEDIPIPDRPIVKETKSTKERKEKVVKLMEKSNVKEKTPSETTASVSQETKSVIPPPPRPPSTVKKPSFTKSENIYKKLEVFFEDYFNGYLERYERWENAISSILAILRKMRKITRKNTEDLLLTINNLHKKIIQSLELFKIKRDEIEKVAGVDIKSMSSEFKKVLGLLELQVKEYQLKKLTDEYIHQQESLT
ncbi:MAG: hypothetical protein ACTSRH_02490 [Promethearchaeota archaeon]